MRFDVPILFIVFNRPETTERVFNEIRKQKPKYLFVAADGPRTNVAGEAENCKKARDVVMSTIDWDCELKTLFQDENLGCGLAVSGAITWFFENVEEGIILEDDTLPDLSFFSFCKNLLEKYRHEDRIKMISGNSFQKGKWRGDGSYYFSAYSHIWGWASWRRTWKQYNFLLDNFSEQQFNLCISNYFRNEKIREYWLSIFENVRQGKVDTWDYQLLFSIWRIKGISILPNKNLVSNIGFGENATHTTNLDDPKANNILGSIDKIVHPSKIIISNKADIFYFKKYLEEQFKWKTSIKNVLSVFRN